VSGAEGGGEPFPRLVAALRATRLPAALHAQEMPAPTRIARAAWAVSGWVDAEVPGGGPPGTDEAAPAPAGDDVQPDEPVAADGRFVLLHGLRSSGSAHPGRSAPPGGDWRVVVLVRAVVDVTMADDPLVTAVAWQVLREVLEQADARAVDATATVTRSISERFGRPQDQGPDQTVELRASWTPVWDTDPVRAAPAHLVAWAGLLAHAGGLPEGVQAPGRPVASPGRPARHRA
jgi:hypothetical protein